MCNGQVVIDKLTRLGKALSDPLRVRMLGLMAMGRDCCDLPCCNVPEEAASEDGICVCEFTQYYGLGQSKVSYHLGILKNAGLVREEKRGKWSFYTVDRAGAREMLDCLSGQLFSTEGSSNAKGGTCCE